MQHVAEAVAGKIDQLGSGGVDIDVGGLFERNIEALGPLPVEVQRIPTRPRPLGDAPLASLWAVAGLGVGSV